MKRLCTLLLASLAVLFGMSAVGRADVPEAEVYTVSPDGTLLVVHGPKLAPDGPISFEISVARLEAERTRRPLGQMIRCFFRNNGPEPVAFYLKEHDEYLGALPYPENIQARIENSAHKVLTVNEVDKEGWWTHFYFSDQTFKEEPGDRITIPPGGQITRLLKLYEVLSGSPGLPGGLPAGHFVLQMRIGALESNRLELDVDPIK